MGVSEHSKAQKYQRKRNWITLFDMCLTVALLGLMVQTNIHTSFLELAKGYDHKVVQILVFFLLFSIYFFIFQVPLRFYSSYVLEKQFNLSNQSLASWSLESCKRYLVSFIFMFLLVLILYYLIWNFPDAWWACAWLTYALISLGIGKLFPILIAPLFYKFLPIENEQLRIRVLNLVNRFGMKLENVYTFNLSKTTKKANAAFCGIGSTKRIMLADTLLKNFTEDEIEMVIAHELGHYRNHDIWKQFIIGLLTSLAIFYVAFDLLNSSSLGRQGIDDLLLLPNLCIILFVANLLVGPFINAYSRFIEREADRFALQTIPAKDVFISTMEKLCATNLADPNPNPVIEFLLYDHPSIGKRIRFAHEFK